MTGAKSDDSIESIVEDVNELFDEPRDPDRISRILAKLERYWLEYPDLRIGQIISSAYQAEHNTLGDPDPFSMSDDAFERYLDKRLAEINDDE